MVELICKDMLEGWAVTHIHSVVWSVSRYMLTSAVTVAKQKSFVLARAEQNSPHPPQLSSVHSLFPSVSQALLLLQALHPV